MSVRAAIVLQARMGSSRLPGKTLAPIAGRSLLTHCIERLSAGASRLPVIVATTTLPADEAIVRDAVRLGALAVRGPDEDVLARFLLAATEHSLTHVIRATADNPAVDIDAAGRVLDLCVRHRVDHVIEYGLPVGAAVEAVTVDALRQAAELTTEASHREHVTSFVRRDPRFRTLPAIAPSAVRHPRMRLTVDTAEDLEWMRRIYNQAQQMGGSSPIPLPLLIAAAEILSRPAPAASGNDTDASAR